MCGGGGAAAPANTSSTISQTTIPGWAKPMAQAAMGSAMEQAFNIDRRTGDILGPKQYIPYGVDPALQDAIVKAQSNPILNWSAAQQKKHPEQYAAAQAQLADAQRNFQQAGQKAYMPYEQGETYGENGSSRGSAAVAGFSPMQMQAFRDAQALRLPSQFAEGSDLVRQAAAGSLGLAQMAPQLGQTALGYGSQAAGYGAQAAGYGSQAVGFGSTAAQIGQEGYRRAVEDAQRAAGMSDVYGQQGAGYGSTAADMARLGYEAEQRYRQQATSPAVMQQYMNPYVQAALAPQLQQLAQQTGIAGAAQQAAATSSGAFGGSRSALANALTQQAGNLAAQQALGQGYNQAYQQAQQSLQYGSGLGISGLQAGTQAQQTGIQGSLAGLQGVGQRINAGQLGLAGAGMGIQGQKVGIEGAATGIQGAGVGVQGAQAGIQGVNAATAANQMGLSGYGQVGNQGVNLANIGNQQLGAQQGIIGFQSQMGGMQQQQAQNIINAAMNQYDRSQAYPYQQIGFISNILRGTPVQGTGSEQMYQAAPNPWSQVAGLGMNLAGSAMGRYANGGIVDAALVNALRG